MKNITTIRALLLGVLAYVPNQMVAASQVLLLTSDFGCVRRCATREDVDALCQTMISARPDIMAVDATANGLVNYRSAIGFRVPGSPSDALYDAGLEPFGIVVDTLRSHGITVLANVRMNDHHGREIQWTPWERDHREWSLGKDTGARDWKAIGALRQMDYAIEGVRAYRFSILEEVLWTFAVDGLQLDFGRTAPFLSEPKDEKAHLLTAYIRQIRRLLNETAARRERGKMLLGVIVPWDLAFCDREGLEVEKWIQEGLIDYVSPGEWYYADWNIPLAHWRAMTRATQCRLYPLTPGNVSPYQEFEYGEPSALGDNRVLDPPKIRAIADNLLSQQPDGLAFYNFYACHFGAYYDSLRVWTNPAQTRQMSRHHLHCRRLIYHPTERETFDLGVAFMRDTLLTVGAHAERPFRFASATDEGTVRLRCAFLNAQHEDEVLVRLNGVPIRPDTVTETTDNPTGTAGRSVHIWESSHAGQFLVRGANLIQWELAKRAAGTTSPLLVGEFELLLTQ